MAQRVDRSDQHTLRPRSALAAAFGERIDAEDLDGLTAAYTSLHERVTVVAGGEVLTSPPPIMTGDLRFGPLAICVCPKCTAVIGAAFVEDARPRGGSVVYVLDTQHPAASPEPWRTVPVVLAGAGDIERGRPPLQLNDRALTHCRSHGLLTVKTAPVLRAARKMLDRCDAGKHVTLQRVEAF